MDRGLVAFYATISSSCIFGGKCMNDYPIFIRLKNFSFAYRPFLKGNAMKKVRVPNVASATPLF